MTKFLAEFVDGGPGCSRDDCMRSIVRSTSTLAHYQPTYDSNGNDVNPDKNKHVNDIRCLSCGKSWSETI
jgi:hypothetical protein